MNYRLGVIRITAIAFACSILAKIGDAQTPAAPMPSPHSTCGPRVESLQQSHSSYDWWIPALHSLKEETLCPVKADAPEVYRFVWLNSWGGGEVYRLTPARNGYSLHIKSASGRWGAQIERIEFDSVIAITPAEWRVLRALLVDSAAFWTSSLDSKDSGLRADGDL